MDKQEHVSFLVTSASRAHIQNGQRGLGVCAAGIAGWEDFISNLAIV